MPEYDMPLEEQVKLLVREFKTFKGSIETKFDSIDGRLATLDAKLTTVDAKLMTVDAKLTTVDAKLTTVDARLTTVDARVTTVDAQLTTVDAKLTTVDAKVDKMQILLEQTHAVAKLGLEGVQGLRESTDEKFAAAAKTNAEQTDLLKSLIVNVRKRVERVERPRRRRS